MESPACWGAGSGLRKDTACAGRRCSPWCYAGTGSEGECEAVGARSQHGEGKRAADDGDGEGEGQGVECRLARVCRRAPAFHRPYSISEGLVRSGDCDAASRRAALTWSRRHRRSKQLSLVKGVQELRVGPSRIWLSLDHRSPSAYPTALFPRCLYPAIYLPTYYAHDQILDAPVHICILPAYSIVKTYKQPSVETCQPSPLSLAARGVPTLSVR